MNRFAYSRAFTLIELMVTVAIAAILLGIAVPSFNDFIQKRAVNLKTVEVRGALELARGLAISQRQTWKVCTVDALNSCVLKDGVRLIVFRDDNSNNALDVGESLHADVALNALDLKLSVGLGQTSLAFRGSGEALLGGNFEICSENSSFDFGRRAIVFISGRIRLSSDSDADGYDDTGGVKIQCPST